MSNQVSVVAGMYWGDEGKGRVIDNENGEVVVRVNGGNNAGHTVYVGDIKYALHFIPSGIIRPGCLNVMGRGELLEPEAFFDEKQGLVDRGVKITPENLKIGRGVNIIMPWHKAFDGIKGGRIDTTLKGIGPAYTDHTGRIAIFAKDLLDEDVLRAKIEAQLDEKNDLLVHKYGHIPFDAESAVKRYLEFGRRLGPYLVNSRTFVRGLMREGRRVVVEMAQGAMLDIDHGTYPYNTCSNTTIAGVMRGLGLSHKDIGRVVGVLKAYPTRVGKGPFPTELSTYDEVDRDRLEKNPDGSRKPPIPMTETEVNAALLGDDVQLDRHIRRIGDEFGTTTGRPRRVGWPDMVVALYAVEINGIDEIAVTKLDILDGIPIKIARGYIVDGKETTDFCETGEPVYEDRTFGWDPMDHEGRMRAVHDGFGALPKGMQETLGYISSRTGVPVGMATIGKEREMVVTKGVREATEKYVR